LALETWTTDLKSTIQLRRPSTNVQNTVATNNSELHKKKGAKDAVHVNHNHEYH